MTKKRVRGNPIPLIIEKHPEEYTGYPFVTLIQYRDEPSLVIVDNMTDKDIKAYVLDCCGPEKISEELIVTAALDWYSHRRDRYPVSFEFSRLGLTNDVGKIYRTFNIEFVTRIIGPLPRFNMSDNQTIKRRKRKAAPTDVHFKKLEQVSF